ncbi:MAG TPA: biotin/lipoyl-containing protein [Candidatus Tumulicola sp.]|jgi:biotin carboxyl carrier protein
MPETANVAERVRRLAEFLAQTDAVRVSIQRGGDTIEVARPARTASSQSGAGGRGEHPSPGRIDTIKADLVGVFRLSRPAPAEGEILEADRELAYIEALGIRNPVHSLGGGRIVAIASNDGAAVEYGQPLFLLDRR